MVFTVADLIVRPSWDATLLADTFNPARTPTGVGFTRQPRVFPAAGDQVSIEIEGIGYLTNREKLA
jgi:2-keto-4-pentenoate hydratase/2-oxohepta-3-ene-1,7-dioic acid hydratase in catechol pathway